MKKFNNKKRQNAVFCLKQERIYLRFLRGQNIPNGYYRKSHTGILMPEVMKRYLKEAIMNEFGLYKHIEVRPVEKYRNLVKS